MHEANPPKYNPSANPVDRPQIVRIALSGIAVCFIIWSIFDTGIATLTAMFWYALQTIGVIATIRFPKVAGIALIATDFCAAAFPGVHVSTFAGMFLAIGLLSYETDNVIAAITFAVSAVSQAVQQWLFLGGDFSYPPYAAITVTYLLAALAGSMVRVSEQMARIRISAEQTLHYSRHAVALGNQIHDHVTGELVMIIRIAQHRLRTDPGSTDNDHADRKAWLEVERSARKALADTREVIDMLDHIANTSVESTSEAADNDAFANRVRSLVADKATSLASAGFHGQPIVNIGKDVRFSNPSCRQLILDTITELANNIARHGDPSENYSLAVIAHSQFVSVTSSNAARANDDMVAGRGLDSLQDRIRARGGSIAIETEERMHYCIVTFTL